MAEEEEPRWSEETPPGERLLYDVVRAALPSDVHVLVNVMLSVPARGRPEEVEVDLVIVDPRFGVVVVEVKGGTISYDAIRAAWWRSDGRGKVIRDPVQQAKRARSVIRECLKQGRFPTEEIPLRWAVATPECVLDDLGAILPDQCRWDARDLARMPEAIGRVQGEFTLGEVAIGEVRAAAIVRTLRGRSVEGRPSSAGQVQRHEQRIHAYTASHREVLNRFVIHKRVVVRGSAGTGKTFLAVEAAARFAAQGDRVLLTCWHRLLAHDLRQQLGWRLAEMGCPRGTEVTDDPAGGIVVTDLAALAGGGQPPPGVESQRWYYEVLPDRLEPGITGGQFDVIVLDEAQDPSELWLHAIAMLLREGGRWYAFTDRQQDLFGTANPLKDFIDAAHDLRENFRNTVEIAHFAGIFGEVELDCVSGNGPPVTMEAVAADRIIPRLPEIARKLCRDEGYDRSDVAAIWLYHNPWQGNPEDLIDQHARGEIITTNSASFKGMERRAVVLGIDLHPGRTLQEHLRSIYTAATRARSHLVVVADPDQLRREGHYLLAGMFKDEQPADEPRDG